MRRLEPSFVRRLTLCYRVRPRDSSVATWRSGYATVCKTVYPGSIPGVASTRAALVLPQLCSTFEAPIPPGAFMSNDRYVEVSRQGYFSRLANSFVGILIGFVLAIGAIPLLWWNEGHAVV